jgi:Transposase domain (DUF772)
MRFLGLGLGDAVPDANTIWTFREALTKAGATPRLFELFDQELRAAGSVNDRPVQDGGPQGLNSIAALPHCPRTNRGP